MKSILGFVPGWISLSKLRFINSRKLRSDLITSPLTIFFSSFKGKPELIVAIGKLLHLVSFLRNEDFPVNTLISISSANIRLSLVTSPV